MITKNNNVYLNSTSREIIVGSALMEVAELNRVIANHQTIQAQNAKAGLAKDNRKDLLSPLCNRKQELLWIITVMEQAKDKA
tara:strand:+ start:599 stop:844 length:246 start_codon:yes stop_codon:yes gene_type:complete